MIETDNGRFKFGENWADYSTGISDVQIKQAVSGLLRLFHQSELNGKTFLDIGSGSGLHSLAALKLGASSIEAFDIDEASVATTRKTLQKFAPEQSWNAQIADVLQQELKPNWDVVYSWGVLHHTGSMWTAIKNAAGGVKQDGIFAIAIYNKTPLCHFWTWEKRLYANASLTVQKIIQGLFKTFFVFGLIVSGRNPKKYIGEYKSNRGMNWHHDIHDWLGGYPYESASTEQLVKFLKPMGFSPETIIPCNTKWGIFGVGCNEIRFRRKVSDLN